jgi:hypothetical protein
MDLWRLEKFCMLHRCIFHKNADVPDWFISKKIFSSEMWPNEPKFGRKHLWKVQYKVCSKQNER